MKRYLLRNNSLSIIFPYSDGVLIAWEEICKKAPLTAKYLEQCKSLLIKREKGRFAGQSWYCFSRNQALEVIANKKILTADLNPSASYCIDETGEVCFPGGAAGGYGILTEDHSLYYVLGLLNSTTVDFCLKNISTNYRGGWYGYDAKAIRNLPIIICDLNNKEEKAHHDKLVSLVEAMLDLHKRLQGAKTPNEKRVLEREIESTDRAIDELVYVLYGLTEEEIKIVEQTTA